MFVFKKLLLSQSTGVSSGGNFVCNSCFSHHGFRCLVMRSKLLFDSFFTPYSSRVRPFGINLRLIFASFTVVLRCVSLVGTIAFESGEMFVLKIGLHCYS